MSLLNTATAHPPSKTALLLLDYHNHIVNKINPAETKTKVLSAASALLQAARDNSVVVAHCLIDAKSQPVETSKLKQRWDQQFKPLPAEELHEHADLAAPSAPTDDKEFVMVKVPGCVSALKTEGFVSSLRRRGIESLVICGVVTSGAVLSTARDAADLGFVTTVVADGCWDYVPDVHEVILNKILPMTAFTADLDGGLKLLGR